MVESQTSDFPHVTLFGLESDVVVFNPPPSAAHVEPFHMAIWLTVVAPSALSVPFALRNVPVAYTFDPPTATAVTLQ